MDFDDDLKQEREAKKEAKRVQSLFRDVFENKQGREALEILGNYFETHLPSMRMANFDALEASYRDGQKAVLVEITDIIKGKYNE